ncbi:Uncharacterized membrane protein [Pseudomonas asturiensis]|uniref:Uncharacterized membrane protein n=1 Tax=Pseudomonas asturiensis TaxID=1190415 RepID=A0A1M7KCW0_9PSED|nr:DUF2254 domain-containing protein [Pseudomonas asturiensis]SHM62844.1 Uncharacterized membrane protein [Pseudomonas asturiensis]
MNARWHWALRAVLKQLWFRATVFSVLGILSALLAVVFKDYVPQSLSTVVGSDAVDKILGILASSMLAVTTFSLSTMVSAYGSTSSGVTPRATTLMMEDATTQNALATFIGSFLFSLVGIIALSTGVYGSGGRALLFGVTIAVIVIIVYTLLRWIDHLSRLGRIGETIDLVENATSAAIKNRSEWPNMGACVHPGVVPGNGLAVNAVETGYVQHLDIKALIHVAEHSDVALYVDVVPGSFVTEGEPLVWLVPHSASGTRDLEKRIRSAFTLGIRRTFEHDPRFGLSVLAEIASRALSPAVNDPGTAIDVLGRGVRTLGCWQRNSTQFESKQPVCCNVFIRSLDTRDLFDDFFSPIARDGAALIEVNVRFLKALGSLVRLNPAFVGTASRHADHLLQHAGHALVLDEEKERLRILAGELGLVRR